jgi:hypothetical protein
MKEEKVTGKLNVTILEDLEEYEKGAKHDNEIQFDQIEINKESWNK